MDPQRTPHCHRQMDRWRRQAARAAPGGSSGALGLDQRSSALYRGSASLLQEGLPAPCIVLLLTTSSFAPRPKSEKPFARQYSYEPPPAFPPASPCSGIVHHLSGPNRYAHTQTFHKRSWSVDDAKSHRSLSLRLWVCHPPTRIHVRLLGPCF